MAVRDLTARTTIKDRLWVRIYILIYRSFLFLYFSIEFLRESVGVVRIGGLWTGPWGGPWTQSVGLVHGPGVSVFGSPRDSHFMSLYAAPYLGLLTNFSSCVFVVGSVWRIFKLSIEPLQLRRRIFKTLISRSYLINFLITGGFLWRALFAILSLIWSLIVC